MPEARRPPQRLSAAAAVDRICRSGHGLGARAPDQSLAPPVAGVCPSPVAPTIFFLKPFGHEVEGLSHFRDKTYAVERPVQTDDFEDSTLCSDISRKPFGPKVLRKFKCTDRQINGFVTRAARSLDLDCPFDGSQTLAVRRNF